MKESDAHHGSKIDCFVFAKLYLMIVVLYVGSSNVNAPKTIVLDGRPNSLDHDHIKMMEGIHPDKIHPGPVEQLMLMT
jgi:hypothetical protein